MSAPALQANPANHVVIIELGENDCAYIDIDHTRANLDQMLNILAPRRVPVLEPRLMAIARLPSLLGTGPTSCRPTGNRRGGADRQIARRNEGMIEFLDMGCTTDRLTP
ncbi:hypothetical protein [Mesorhizobium sp. Cs1299R1N3]|uniref:hypothetical protein n=1 Tax=Mesorhizobium sp. Cs1299R1N3 TaxID=3015173 RepID=UPI00301DA840